MPPPPPLRLVPGCLAGVRAIRVEVQGGSAHGQDRSLDRPPSHAELGLAAGIRISPRPRVARGRHERDSGVAGRRGENGVVLFEGGGLVVAPAHGDNRHARLYRAPIHGCYVGAGVVRRSLDQEDVGAGRHRVRPLHVQRRLDGGRPPCVLRTL